MWIVLAGNVFDRPESGTLLHKERTDGGGGVPAYHIESARRFQDSSAVVLSCI